MKILFLLLWSVSSFASTFQTEVAGVDLARDASEKNLIFLAKDGMVATLPSGDLKTLSVLSEAIGKHQLFRVTLNEKKEILALTPVGAASSIEGESYFSSDSFTEAYEPTLVPDMKQAQTIFNELNPYYRGRSQCYNRAHIWSYETNQNRQVKSMKVFLFFTAKYIRDYNWDWWFHVSPYLIVSVNGVPAERVIDYAFMKGPVDMQTWTNYFMEPQVTCPTVAKYSDYEKHQYESYCYLIKRSMYFWQPLDIENQETTGKEKTAFISGEVSHAYWQAF